MDWKEFFKFTWNKIIFILIIILLFILMNFIMYQTCTIGGTTLMCELARGVSAIITLPLIILEDALFGLFRNVQSTSKYYIIDGLAIIIVLIYLYIISSPWFYFYNRFKKNKK